MKYILIRLVQFTEILIYMKTSNSHPTSSEHQNYQSSNFEFAPPQHKYVTLEKFKSPFFGDHKEEQYVLQRAFQANNFTYLRDLPDNFSRNCILDQRKQRVAEQLQSEALKRSKMPNQLEETRRAKIEEIKKAKVGNLGYFEVFPYKESDYQIPKKLVAEQRKQNDKKRNKICEVDFRPAGFDAKMKYQDPFRYIDRFDSTTKIMDLSEKQKYLFPFHLSQDAYDSFHESQKRRKIAEKQLLLAGEFIPSKKQQSLNPVSKAKLPEILNQIEHYFKKYLKGEFGYFIGVSKRDHIQMLFEGKFQGNQRLEMAMSGILEHQILCKFVLRRNFQRWGQINPTTGYLQFVAFPPWVKNTDEKLRAPTAPTNYSSQSKRHQH